MTNLSTADLLRNLCDAWDAFGDDAAGPWERKMDALVEAARLHLQPQLEVDDPAPAPRCCPGGQRGEK